MTNNQLELAHVPAECTLPTLEQPLRVAEWKNVLALVREAERPERTRLRLTLQPAPGRAETVHGLAARESACCSFFKFAVREEDDGVLLEVIVPPARLAVLDALAERVDQAIGTADHR